MTKEEGITICFEDQTGLRISQECELTTGKVIVNDIEITSVEDWEKVIKSLNDLQVNNQKLNDQLDRELIKRARLEDRIKKAIAYMEECEKEGTLWAVKSTDKLKELLKGEE